MAGVRRIPGAKRDFVEAPGDNPEAYYDMAPEALSQLPPEILLALGLTTDPNNDNPNVAPMRNEDDENGYWDAKNMGNGRGDSFVMENGKRLDADPVGRGTTMEQILQLIGNAPPPDGGPSEGPPRRDDPYFAGAQAAWIDEMGREPETDGDYAEIEEWAAELLEESAGDVGKLNRILKQR